MIRFDTKVFILIENCPGKQSLTSWRRLTLSEILRIYLARVGCGWNRSGIVHSDLLWITCTEAYNAT
jgi:hypothetical protein